MVAVAEDIHSLRWLSPSPMWRAWGDLAQLTERAHFVRPAILRFANDDFMDEFISLMSLHSERLAEWLAENENWRTPLPTPPTLAKFKIAEPVSQFGQRQSRESKAFHGETDSAVVAQLLPTANEEGLKLYQPVHQRFYLVSASLVCRQPGLPDRAVDAGKQEKVGFVIRRLEPETAGETPTPGATGTREYAFVPTSTGPHWIEVVDDSPTEPVLVEGEQRMPLFRNDYVDHRDKKRRLHAGLIPVARREAYMGAPLVAVDGSGAPAEAALDPRMVLFEVDVAAPWKNLIEQARAENIRLFPTPPASDRPPLADEFTDPDPDPGLASVLHAARGRIQTISWYVLIDLARFLQTHLLPVYQRLTDGTVALEPLQDAVFTKLEETVLDPDLVSEFGVGTDNTLAAVLALIASSPNDEIAQGLERVETDYVHGDTSLTDWPDFLFPLADPEFGPTLPNITVVGVPDGENADNAVIDEFSRIIDDALDPNDVPTMPATVTPPVFPEGANPNDAWFAIRCVYERPNCGPFSHPVVSLPSRVFQMASFFDSDGPARPIRIPMPIDVTPAGLRKYARNTSFMISDSLCGQIDKVKRLTLADLVLSVLPWPFHKDLPNIGEPGPCHSGSNALGIFCSLSIPIVTLCALILLIIMVALFDTFFKWIPLLFVCFPLLGLRGKKTT